MPLIIIEMILTAVFLLSLSALSFEILLVRSFSISQWNHLSFMVISITLFGFAAGGTCLNIIDIRKKTWEKHLSSFENIHIFTILYTLSAIVSFIVLNRIPLDYFRLPLEPIQALYLLTAYLLLALPFFFTGLVVSIAYAFMPGKTGFVYFANMAGSAFGAIIPVMLLPFIPEGKLIILSALIPLATIFLKQSGRHQNHILTKKNFLPKRKHFRIFSFGIVIIASILIVKDGNNILRVKPSPYKKLSQTLLFPHTRITETINSIRGRFEDIESPHLRFAPGLSLKYNGMLPDQTAMFKDGDNPLFLYQLNAQTDAKFSTFTLPYTGYLLAMHPKHILVIQHGGGSAIPCALASGADNITIVEQQPQIASRVRKHYKLQVINQNPRTFLARSHRQYDIIHLENWGTSLPGSAALTQDYFFTIESFTQYFQHLSNNGILIVSRLLLLPPSDVIRLWATAYESLRSLEIKTPEKHIVIFRNWNTFTMIVSVKPFSDTIELKNVSQNLNFDIVYIPGISKENVNRFNIFDAPYHHIEINRLAKAYKSKKERTYFENYPIDVIPQTDNRPFPYRFLKWSRLTELYKMTGSRFYSLLMSGEIVVSVVLIEASGISILFLFLPFFTILKETRKFYFSHMLYFFAVGSGFMFIELFFIKQYIFVFGDPVISLTIVITGLLVFSAFGGYCSQRVSAAIFPIAIAALIAALICMFFVFKPILHGIIQFNQFLRYALSLLLLIPPGFLMGLPFPLGMRYILNIPAQRAYAWTINGCASVLASVASAQIALSSGISSILIFAILAYVLAFITLKLSVSNFKRG
jgi:spermidine synthase